MFMTSPRMIGFKKYLVNGFSGGGSPPPNYETVKFFLCKHIVQKIFDKECLHKKIPLFWEGDCG